MIRNFYVALFLMAGVTYLIRVLPLLLIRREIRNRTLRSYFYYLPFVTLSVMTFPAVLSATGALYSALAAFLLSAVLAREGKHVTEAEGIIDKDVDRSIHNLTSIGKEAMCATDDMVLNIMTHKS